MPIYSAGSASVQIVPDFSHAQEAISEWFARQGDFEVTVHPVLDQADMASIRTEIAALGGTTTVRVEVDRGALQASLQSALADAVASAGGGGGRDGGALSAALAGAAAGRATGGGGGGIIGGTLAGLAAPLALPAAGLAGLYGAGGFTSHLALHALPLIGDMLPALGALGVLPAMFTSLGASMFTVRTALDGVSTAFKGLSDTATPAQLKAAQQALAGMAPAARQFVLAIAPLQKVWDQIVKNPVQQAFFSGLTGPTQDLAKVALPQIGQGLTGIAQSTNQALLLTIHQLIADSNVFAGIWKNIDAARQNSIPVLRNVAEIMVQITGVGSQFLPAMAQHLTTVTTKWANWVDQAAKTGQLFNIIQTGLTTLHEIVTLIINLGKIVADVLHASQGIANNVLQILVQVTGQLAAFLRTAPAMDALKSIFTALHTEAALVLPILEQFIQIALVQLGQVLHILQPLLTALATAFNQIFQAAVPLWNAVAALVEAALKPLVAALVPVIPYLTQFVQILAKGLTQAIQAITPIMPPIAKAFGDILQALAPLLPALAHLVTALLPPFVSLIKAVAPAIPEVADALAAMLKPLPGIVNALTTVVNFLAKPFTDLINFLKPALPAIADAIALWYARQLLLNIALKAWAAVQWLVNAAMDANPITLFMAALALLTLAIYELVTHWKQVWQAIRDFFVLKWIEIRDAWTNTWNALVDWFKLQIATFLNDWHNIWTAIKDFFIARWTDLKNFWMQVWTGLEAWFQIRLNNFIGFWTGIWTTVKNNAITAWNDIVSGIEGIWATIEGIVATPINFVIHYVFNDGLFKAWNWVVDKLGLSSWQAGPWAELPVGKQFYTGGYTGPGGMYDPAGIVHAGEFVFDQQKTAMYRPLFEYIHALPGYATGGFVNPPAGLLAALANPTNPAGVAQAIYDMLAGYTDASGAGGGVNSEGSQFMGWVEKIPKALLDLLWGGVKGAVTGALHAIVQSIAQSVAPGGAVATVPSSYQNNVAIVQRLAAGYGWGDGQEWNDLVAVIMMESGFNNNAQNPTSTAYGMFQFLDSTWAGYPYGKTSDPIGQTVDGLLYIKQRYGDPIGAYNHEQLYHWYDQGGWLPPGYSSVFNGTGTPEAILTGSQWQDISSLISGASGGSAGAMQPVWHFYLGDREITDLVDARLSYQHGTMARNLRSNR